MDLHRYNLPFVNPYQLIPIYLVLNVFGNIFKEDLLYSFLGPDERLNGLQLNGSSFLFLKIQSMALVFFKLSGTTTNQLIHQKSQLLKLTCN